MAEVNVQFSDETETVIIGAFAMPQPDLPFSGEVDQGDTRYVTFLMGPPAQQLAVKVAAGMPLESTGTPAVDATYSVDQGSQQSIAAVAQYIAAFAEFPADQTELPWADITGTFHVFTTTTLFMAFARAAADYVTKCNLAAQADPINWPATPVVIA